MFIADLHIHSKYSRATATTCDLENLSLWAQKKGISVIATGDFTHPTWLSELKEKLLPDESGLFTLRSDLSSKVNERLPKLLRRDVRFILSVEISTIYKKGERTRKVHHVLYAPSFEAAQRIAATLSKIGNIASDGRPILGLDSRDLLELVLESDPGSFLIPAHIWTPWFSALGSKSGFDSIEECYGDLAQHIFAVETGLSSDPAMNWRVSSLDKYRLVSNSDAHSPQKLGREACIFDTETNYYSIRQALETGKGYVGTVEFFPEEGKYHLDGHRKCEVRFDPAQTRKNKGLCTACGKPVTVGVMHRVEELTDKDETSAPPPTAGKVVSLIPLNEILAEIQGVGPASKSVTVAYEGLIANLGSELDILTNISLEEISRIGNSHLTEAISRLRKGKVIREAGYDGEYGAIKLFAKGELSGKKKEQSLFNEYPISTVIKSTPSPSPLPQGERVKERVTMKSTSPLPRGERVRERVTGESIYTGINIISGLDPDQQKAADHTKGALLIVAGPGSGKTRTLTLRTANLIAKHGIKPESLLAVTFTRRAQTEMQERLKLLLPDKWKRVPVHTFHSLSLSILREEGHLIGLKEGFRIADEEERVDIIAKALDVSKRKAFEILAKISEIKRTAKLPDEKLKFAFDAYTRALDKNGLLDFDDLISLSVKILKSDDAVLKKYRERYPWISIDEYQDIDERQYELVSLLAPADANICAIGDPDQAIYGFRGAHVGFFNRFTDDYPDARVVNLKKNYRSVKSIVDASSQVIGASPSPCSLLSREKEALRQEVMGTSKNTNFRGPLIAINESPTDKAEAEFVVSSIEKLIGGHTFFSIDSGRADDAAKSDLSFSDFGVLYRTNAQADVLCEAFHRSGLPFQKRSHNRLAGHPGVRLIAEELRKDPTEKPLSDRIKLWAQDPSTAEAAELVSPIAERCNDDVYRFLSEIALGEEIDTWHPNAERISLLTLHASKGLEFKVVFIVGCEDGILPLTFENQDLPPSAPPYKGGEERRLFYVGMTRAKQKLFLSHAKKRMIHGKQRETRPSPFLMDIEKRLIEIQKSAIKKSPAQRAKNQMDLF